MRVTETAASKGHLRAPLENCSLEEARAVLEASALLLKRRDMEWLQDNVRVLLSWDILWVLPTNISWAKGTLHSKSTAGNRTILSENRPCTPLLQKAIREMRKPSCADQAETDGQILHKAPSTSVMRKGTTAHGLHNSDVSTACENFLPVSPCGNAEVRFWVWERTRTKANRSVASSHFLKKAKVSTSTASWGGLSVWVPGTCRHKTKL